MLIPDQKGFTHIILLFCLPMVISLCLGLYLVYESIQQSNKEQYQCQNYLLKAQASYLNSLNQLISLNPKAKILRQKYKQAKAIYLNAPPKLKPPAQIYMLYIKAKQLMLRAKQINLKNKMHSNRLKYLVKLKKNFSNNENIVNKHYRYSSFILKAKPIMSTTPSYSVYMPNVFMANIHFQWSAKLFTQNKNIRNLLLKFNSFKTKIINKKSCKVMAIKKGAKWVSQLS